MVSPRSFAPAARGLLLARALTISSRLASRPLLPYTPLSRHVRRPGARIALSQCGFASASSRSPADEIIEAITDQYATAKDEFEIAVESTEENTVYAPEDRAAASEEMARLSEMYETALRDQPTATAADIKRRIGQRIRELDEAIKGLEESATRGD